MSRVRNISHLSGLSPRKAVIANERIWDSVYRQIGQFFVPCDQTEESPRKLETLEGRYNQKSARIILWNSVQILFHFYFTLKHYFKILQFRAISTLKPLTFDPLTPTPWNGKLDFCTFQGLCWNDTMLEKKRRQPALTTGFSLVMVIIAFGMTNNPVVIRIMIASIRIFMNESV